MNDGAVPHAVLVGECAFEDVGDDLHVAVRVHGKSCAWRDEILIDHAQGAEAHPAWVAILVEGKCVARVEPAVVTTATFSAGTNLDHGSKSDVRSQNAEATAISDLGLQIFD